MSEPRDEFVSLSDPRALRALAHPTRLKLVGLLRQEGPATATQLGERLGESAASCSFHLRQLAKWGLVADAGGGKGRNRPWRATAGVTRWEVRTQELAEAAALFSAALAERYLEQLLAWFERMPTEPPAWREAQHIGDTQLSLTADQLDELGKGVWRLIESFQGKQRPGARRVTFLYAAFPAPDTG